MKKRINFASEPTVYRFTLEDESEKVFEIAKNTLTFSSDDFYKLFFRGLNEKPEYELVKPTEELRGQAKHVFDTVAAILKKACDSIDANWFKVSDEQTDSGSDNASDASS